MGLLEELPKYDTDAGELAVEDEGPSQPKRRRRLTLWITCGVVAVTAAVALFIVDRQVEGGVFGQKSVENSLENTSYICFSSRRELDIAVDLYLDQESEALLKQTYGPRIGSWCVDRITDFSQLFSVQRHPSAATFQQDLSRWNLSLATNLSHMFYGAQDFQGNGLEFWNVLNVADMTGTFFKATRFNANLSAWDTRSVTSLRDTFREALSFAGDGLDQWNVSAVTSLAGTFREAPAMQASLSDWDVQRVTDMNNLFREAKSFQGSLSNWKVDRVTDMAGLFRDAVLFDSELPWNTSSVTDMQWMFSGAESFRGDLSWDVSRVTDMEYLVC